jgi:hypothetical protein
MAERRNAYRILMGKPERRKEGDRKEDVDVDVSMRIILRRIIGRYSGVANGGL